MRLATLAEYTSDPSALRSADFILVAVPTPVDAAHIPDFRPLIGPVPGIAGLHLVAGFSGMGFKISPAVGLVVSELLLDGRASSVDIAAFAPDRFSRGGFIKAEWEYGDEEPSAYT